MSDRLSRTVELAVEPPGAALAVRPSEHTLRHGTAVALFSLTVFVSATLLFTVQPMFARMALPLLGGTPAVWNTCMVFFQAVLLVGYAYAHVATRVLGLRGQLALHLALVLITLLALPIAIPAGWTPPAQQSPVSSLLMLLVVALGLPFLVISTTAPLAQRWFAGTDHPLARDPYFLYAASNVGSLAALLAYPTLIEPNLHLADQSRLWALGYMLLTGLLVGCAAVMSRARASATASAVAIGGSAHVETMASLTSDRVAAWQRARWILLAFVPSSLMLGVTTYLTTDVAPMPLLWVLPLAVYLLTFVLAFGRRGRLPGQGMRRLLPVLMLPLALTIAFKAIGPLWVLATLHVLAFFVISTVCHGELARSRPAPARLTEFFLWVAVGGVLGGIFNALIAPLAFTHPIEYPLLLVVACLIPATDGAGRAKWASWELVVPLGLAALIAGLVWLVRALPIVGLPGLLLCAGVPAVLCFALRHRAVAFGLALAALMLTMAMLTGGGEYRTLHRERSFFGVWQVRVHPADKFTALVNGTTDHGRQSRDPERELEPLSYFHRAGPIGQVFGAMEGTAGGGPVGIIGLGTGSLACHGRPGQAFTFYEIDPAVVRIARDPRYFTYLKVCPPVIQVVLGDARQSLTSAPDRHYRLIVLDAFSSDAIPTHLLTREALRLYLDKLAESGLLALHISNRHLDLEPTVANLAHDAKLVALAQLEVAIGKDDAREGRTPSHWVVLARRPEELGALREDARWRSLSPRPDRRLWTDDFSNILEVIKWR
jgi:hypothetical protein